MANIADSLSQFLMGGDPLLRAVFSVIFLLAAHIIVKIISRFLANGWASKDGLTKKEVEARHGKINYLKYFLDGIAIIIALFYLNTSLTGELSQAISASFPRIVSAGLIGILGIIAIKIFAKIGEDFLKSIGAESYLREIGLSGSAVSFSSVLVKGFLYLLLLQVVLSELGIGDSFVREFITASSWAAALVIGALIFYGSKDLIKNYAAGVYLKSSRHVRQGEEISLDDKVGEINSLSLFSTNIDTKNGNIKVVPNSQIMEGEIKLRKTKRDIETLDEIKNYFVAQNPSYCGPASLEMALEIFGYRYDQDRIGEKAGCEVKEGTRKEDMIKTVEELTDGEVKAALVPYDKITDLGDEFKTWFNDGALIVPNFYKPEIFPEATTGHYVLSVGVENSDILIMDPNPDTGGVYYVDKGRLKKAMSEFDHKRGYIVLAPEGTNSYWRIENDLLYSDKTYYDEISKALESKLRKTLRQGRVLKEATPSSIDKYMDKWRKEDKVSRLWKPSEDNSEE